MFYEPGGDHGLQYDPFKACVVPRPIGWISTVSLDGKHNLAPYSQFNNLTFDPPYVMFAANQTTEAFRKDSVVNVEATGRFVWNLATYALREAVNITATELPPGVDEFERAGLENVPSRLLKNPEVPMVKQSPVNFEYEHYSTLRLPGNPPLGPVDVVIARVVGIHIKDEFITNGKLDVKKTMPIARLGYFEYTVVKETFEMIIPGANKAMLVGLEGNLAKNQALGDERQKSIKSDEEVLNETAS